jgi:hypothetical protein
MVFRHTPPGVDALAEKLAAAEAAFARSDRLSVSALRQTLKLKLLIARQRATARSAGGKLSGGGEFDHAAHVYAAAAGAIDDAEAAGAEGMAAIAESARSELQAVADLEARSK